MSNIMADLLFLTNETLEFHDNKALILRLFVTWPPNPSYTNLHAHSEIQLHTRTHAYIHIPSTHIVAIKFIGEVGVVLQMRIEHRRIILLHHT